MNGVNFSPEQFPQNDLNMYVEMGNKAIKSGDEMECLKWYSKGLNKARELQNREKERLFSNLIITLINFTLQLQRVLIHSQFPMLFQCHSPALQ